jgi:serine/threonine protein kinase
MFSFVKALGQFPEPIARFYTRQLFDGLEALHTVGKMFHGDVKLDNLLVSNTYDLKICDFGFSGSSDTTLVNPCGTLGYLAPEIFTYEGYNGIDADQFSAFVVLFILVCGHPPFHSARQSDPRYRLLSEEAFDEFWSKQSSSVTVSKELKELVQRGLAVDKSLRPSL